MMGLAPLLTSSIGRRVLHVTVAGALSLGAVGPALADVSPAGTGPDGAHLHACNSAEKHMLASPAAYRAAVASCRSAMTYYSHRGVSETTEAGICLYLYYGAMSSAAYAFIAIHSDNEDGAQKAYAVAELELSNVFSDCNTQPNIAARAKHVFNAMYAARPRSLNTAPPKQ